MNIKGVNSMKFSDIELDKWEALKPYLDTVVLPITGLSGFESPHDATIKLEQLRDWLDTIEQPFQGRTVTYPAFHFYSEDLQHLSLNDIIENLKQQGFKFVVAVTAKPNHKLEQYNFDAIIAPINDDELPNQDHINSIIMRMWQK